MVRDDRWVPLDAELAEKVGAAVRDEREARRWTQEEMASRVGRGLGASTLRTIEAGQPGNRERRTLAAIAGVFGWGPDWVDQLAQGGRPTPQLGGDVDLMADDIRELSPEDRAAVQALIDALRARHRASK